MNFDEAEKYLLLLGNEVSAMKLGLENTRTLLAALGKPNEKYLKVQIAGTNGKGSVCAFLNSICLRAGIRTGRYTSPHLISITERVKIDGADISEDDFAKFATRVRDTSETLVANGAIETVPTFFEQVTAIALVAFAETKIELAILETGLGGRLDATTAANAEIAAITRIDLDHQQYLGESLREIADEKAAIIHAGSRVVAARQDRVAERVISGRCAELNIEPVWATQEIVTTTWEHVGYLAYTHSFKTGEDYYDRVEPLMLGRHQAENAAVAIAVAEILNEEFFEISGTEICLGLETATHPGRLEFVDGFLLDGAHNIGGARALRQFLDESISRPIVMVFGSMNDKDIGAIAAALLPRADWLVLATPDNSRAIKAEDLLEFIPDNFDKKRVFITPNAAAAIAKAREVSAEDDLIVVTGSLYLVGEAKRLLQQPEFEI